MSFARLPHPVTWIEWLFKDVKDAGGYTGDEHDCPITPTRVGVLLIAEDETMLCGTAFLFWDDPRPKAIVTSAAMALFDWNEDPRLVNRQDLSIKDPIDDLRATLIKADKFSHLAGFIKDDAEIEAMIEQNRRTTQRPSLLLHDYLMDLMRQGQDPKDIPLIRNASSDWSGELGLVMAMLIMLNSKNCVAVEKIDQTRINRSRARKKKPPLADHGVIHLKLSRAWAKRTGNGSMTREQARAHIVRGHFKVRKGGVFWWSPFMRGQGGGTPTPKTYKVTL